FRTDVEDAVVWRIDIPMFKAVARGRDQLSSHLVIGLIGADSVLKVQVKRVSTVNVPIDTAGLSVHPVQIAEKHRPLVNKLGRSDQRIDLRIALRWIRVEDKSNNLGSRWNAAR